LSNLKLEIVIIGLKVDGLRVVLVNQSLARYKLMPFRVNGVNIAVTILRGKTQMIIGELKEEGGWLRC
jgi:hypothetical protein